MLFKIISFLILLIIFLIGLFSKYVAKLIKKEDWNLAIRAVSIIIMLIYGIILIYIMR